MPLPNTKPYSEKNGKKRQPEVLYPRVVYDESMEFVTNKQAELYFVQHKLMREFLSKKGLIEQFNKFQEKQASLSKSEYGEWFQKWN